MFMKNCVFSTAVFQVREKNCRYFLSTLRAISLDFFDSFNTMGTVWLVLLGEIVAQLVEQRTFNP